MRLTKVSIQTIKGKYRLVFTHDKKRYFLSTGSSDLPQVESIKSQIETDIATNQFDSTLFKYKQFENKQSISFPDLFRLYREHKKQDWAPQTTSDNRILQTSIDTHFNKPPDAITVQDWDSYVKELNLAKITQRNRLRQFSPCFDWGVRNGYCKTNPLKEIKVKNIPGRRVKPFTREEIKLVLESTYIHHPHYYSFILFLLSTGARWGEARALRWQNVSDDCTSVTICESLFRLHRKGTKTGKERTIRLTQDLTKVLLEMKAKKTVESVFTTKNNTIICDNFRRIWRGILDLAGVAYRSPYNTRHTFISHALAKGINPVLVAEIVGNSPEIIYQHYAGCIEGFNQLPELF